MGHWNARDLQRRTKLKWTSNTVTLNEGEGNLVSETSSFQHIINIISLLHEMKRKFTNWKVEALNVACAVLLDSRYDQK